MATRVDFNSNEVVARRHRVEAREVLHLGGKRDVVETHKRVVCCLDTDLSCITIESGEQLRLVIDSTDVWACEGEVPGVRRCR